MSLKNSTDDARPRQLVMVDRSVSLQGKPVKALTEGKLPSGFRNNNRRMVVALSSAVGVTSLPNAIVDFSAPRSICRATVEAHWNTIRTRQPPLSLC